jgi:hypothetical protein
MKIINAFMSIWNFFFGKKKKPLLCAEVKANNIAPVKTELKVFNQPKEKTPEEILIASRNNLNPERFEGESFDEYRRRRKVAKVYAIKRQRLVHNSKNAILDAKGTLKGFTKGITFTGDTSNLKSK